MKLLHHVSLELFVRPGETEAALDALVPVPLAEVRLTQWRRHPTKERTKVYEPQKKGVLLLETVQPGDAGAITVLVYRFSKQRDTDGFIQRLSEMPATDRKKITKNIGPYLDEDGDLVLKLDRAAAEEGRLLLGKGLMAKLTLAAFPKNETTCRAIANTILAGEKEI